MKEIEVKFDVEVIGKSILEVADETISLCNYYDNQVEAVKKVIAIKRGEAYSDAKDELGSNVKVAERYSVDEKSVRNYINIYDGKDLIESESVPNDTKVNTLVKVAKAASEDEVKEILESSRPKTDKVKELADDIGIQTTFVNNALNRLADDEDRSPSDMLSVMLNIHGGDLTIFNSGMKRGSLTKATLGKMVKFMDMNDDEVAALQAEYNNTWDATIEAPTSIDKANQGNESNDSGLEANTPSAIALKVEEQRQQLNRMLLNDKAITDAVLTVYENNTIEQQISSMFEDVKGNTDVSEFVQDLVVTMFGDIAFRLGGDAYPLKDNALEISSKHKAKIASDDTNVQIDVGGYDFNARQINDAFKRKAIEIDELKAKVKELESKPTATDDTSKPSTPHITDTITRTDVDSGEEVTFKDSVDAALNTVAKKSKNGEPVRDNHSAITKASKGVNKNANPSMALGYSWKKGA